MGTSLKVQPFASRVDFVEPKVPRLLINREAVGDSFRFGEPDRATSSSRATATTASVGWWRCSGGRRGCE